MEALSSISSTLYAPFSAYPRSHVALSSMKYATAEATLLALPRFAERGAEAMKPGLERMHALLEATGRPHERFRSVHVAGTNGKGSTASMVAAIASAAGLRVGLHTSPHLWDLAERLRIDGAPAPHDWIAEAVARLRPAFDAVGPSFFEATVALSLLYFAEQAVDLAVVEVGLGGRLDATNVLRPEVAVVTHIGLDHADILGSTREEIAREKAGIAKPGVPLLTAAEGHTVLAAMRETAEARGASFVNVRDEVSVHDFALKDGRLALDLETPVRTYRQLALGLTGAHQVWNAALAVRAAEHVLPAVARSAAPVETGLAEVRERSGLAGRCEIYHLAPLILADVAHNADGLRAALAAARQALASPPGTVYVLLGVMRDKDPKALADILADQGAVVLPIGLPVPRAATLTELKRTLETRGVPVIDVVGAREGVEWFRRHAGASDGLLITGSHLTVAEAVPFL